MREEYREANKGVGWIIGWVLIIVLVIAGVTAGAWAITVALSGVKGQGDGIIKNNSAENWIAAQERFEENYQEFEGTLVKIEVAAQALAADPGNPTLKQNYQSTINYCISVANDYNADSRKFTQEQWKSVDLPETLDAEDCVPAVAPPA